ncbi:MAG: metalloregulator ArsR/SmtB family transcription factor [Rhodospirillales bacterium]
MPTLATRPRTNPPEFKPQDRASAVLKAMGNSHRLKILCHLSRSEASVSELEGVVKLSQSALSQHLAKLRQEGLVKTRRHAQTVYYSLNGTVAQQILKALRAAGLI